MRRIAVPLFALAVAFAPLAFAEAPPPSPVEHPLAVVDALRANDAEAFAEAVSHKSSDALAREWETKRAKAASDEESPTRDADAHRAWSMLRTKEGTAALADELHPKLTEKATTAVLQFNFGLAAMLTAIASEAELTAEESRQASQLVLAVQRWANGVDWADRARLERALGAVASFVRASGLESPRELELLAYEDALALGDDAIAMVKDVVSAYELDLDAILSSIEIEELARDGERATVRTRLTVFAVPLTITRELEYRAGRWVDTRDGHSEQGHDADEAKPAAKTE